MMHFLSSIHKHLMQWRLFPTLFQHSLTNCFVLILMVFMFLYLPVFAGTTSVHSLVNAVGIQFAQTASQTSQQDGSISRRQKLVLRKQHKKYFKHVARCERHWRDLTAAVAAKHGFVFALFCNTQAIRLVVALQYVICFWLPVTIGSSATCALLELWVHRVCACNHRAALVSSRRLGEVSKIPHITGILDFEITRSIECQMPG